MQSAASSSSSSSSYRASRPRDEPDRGGEKRQKLDDSSALQVQPQVQPQAQPSNSLDTLYKDALYSIFHFLGLNDMWSVHNTSKSLQEKMRTFRPHGSNIRCGVVIDADNGFRDYAAFPLRTHITGIFVKGIPVDTEESTDQLVRSVVSIIRSGGGVRRFHIESASFDADKLQSKLLPMVAAIAEANSLDVLQFNGEESWEHTTEPFVLLALPRCTRLRELHFEYFKFTPGALDALLQFVASAPALRTLVMSIDTPRAHDRDECARLFEGLSARTTSISTLDIIGAHVSRENALHLAVALGRPHSTLTCLHLRFCSIRDDALVILAGGITKSKSLTELNVSSNGFGDVGATELFTSIGLCPTLTTLGCSNNHNQFSVVSITALEAALSRPTSQIKTVDIDWCLESQKLGILPLSLQAAMGRVVKASRSLQTLSLNGNFFRDIREMAGGLSASRSLKRLSLESSELVANDLQLLARAVQSSTNLEHLYVTSRVGMPIDSYTCLVSAALQCTTMKSLGVNELRFEDRGHQQVLLSMMNFAGKRMDFYSLYRRTNCFL